MFFIAVATMVAAVGGGSILAKEGEPFRPSGPGFAAPGQMARPGRIFEDLNGTFATTSLPVLGLPEAVVLPSPLAQFVRIELQARGLADPRMVSAEPTNRGPPYA